MMNREKPSLPHGWLVKISHSYPDRVYYFNIHTGVSTWEMPRLITQRPGNKPLKPPQQEYAPKSPCANFSADEDEPESAHNYTDYEANKGKFEPVFSQFQKDIFDDVKNSALGDEVDNLDQNTPNKVLENSLKTEDVGHYFKDAVNEGGKELQDDDVVFKGIGKIYPKVKVKVEVESKGETTKSEKFDNIPSVLSKKRKDVGEADLRRKLDKKSLKEEPDSKRQKSVRINKDLKTIVRTVVNSEDQRISFTSPSSKTKKVLQTDDVETVQRKSERLSTPGGKGIWTRKRRVISESDFEVPSKVEKTDSKPDLSLKIHVGVNSERKVSSESSLDLTSEDTVWKVPPESNTRITSMKAETNLKRASGLKLTKKKLNEECVTAKLDAKIKKKKMAVVQRADVRKVVSSESESNSVQGDVISPYSLQDEKLGLVQEWLKNIDDVPVTKETRAISPIKFIVTERQTTGVVDETEAMEVDNFEESDTEQMVIDLQEMRGELQFCPSQPVCDLSIPPRDCSYTATYEQALYLVIDTSSLINHLKTLSDMRDQEYEGYGLAVLVIPWVVVQELDTLKHRQNLSTSSQNRASKAVKYLNACFAGKHPRVIGQTPKEAGEAVEGLTVECNDDRVLQCCLLFHAKYPSSHTVMLSEDVNLCNKALISGIEACGVKSLPGVLSLPHEENKTANRSSQATSTAAFSDRPISAIHPASSQPMDNRLYSDVTDEPMKSHVTNNQPINNRFASGPNMQPMKSSPRQPLDNREAGSSSRTQGSSSGNVSSVKSHKIRLDRVIVKIKSEIKDTLGPVLETEMKEAFGDVWKTVVHRKPPWSASDIMESFSKHWMAVFGLILPRRLQADVKSVSTSLQLNKVPLLSIREVEDLIIDLKSLMTELQKNSRYKNKVEKSLRNLNIILLDLQNGNVSSQSSNKSEKMKPNDPTLHSKQQKSTTTNQSTPNPTQRIPNSSTSTLPNPKSKSQNTNSNSKPSNSKDTTSKHSKDNENARLKRKPKSSAGNTAEKELSAEENNELVKMCFQIVWENIHNLGCSIEEELHEAGGERFVPVMHRLLSLTQNLFKIFTLCLSISPLSIYDHRNNFEDFVNQMNNFFIRLNFTPVKMVSVTSDNMLTFFHNTSNRPTLQNGLQQLGGLANNLQMLVNIASS